MIRPLREHRVAVRVASWGTASPHPGLDVLCDSCGLVAATWRARPYELQVAHDRATTHVEQHRRAIAAGLPATAVLP